MEKHVSFYMLGKPLSLVDAINRRAAATGSVRYAMLTADADYNGHALALYWNEYRGYYVLDYHWGERVVIHRGTDFAAALDAAKREMARQGRGATLRVTVLAEHAEDVALARAADCLTEGLLNEVPYPRPETPDAWKFAELNTARIYHAEHALITATTKAEWDAALATMRGEVPQRAGFAEEWEPAGDRKFE